jgi:aryl-alcohol dehydrogenase-like predicted oxidoreductase
MSVATPFRSVVWSRARRRGKPFAEPSEIKAVGKIGETGCDDYASAIMKFPGDIVATVSTSVRASLPNTARVFGSKANLRVPSPWFCGATPHLIVEPHGESAQEIVVDAPLNLYAYEADALAALMRGQTPDAPAQTGVDALGNMRALDRFRAQIGLVYPQERAERQTIPASGEALRVYPNKMGYGELRGVVDANGQPKPISKIVMGTMLEGSIDALSHGLALFDDFFERGGTCFDTAFIYGGGMGEKVLGHWLKTRGVRDQVTLIVKGAHPPNCSPAGMRRELAISLERLEIERGDIYMMHRDNLEIGVDEWIDALNEERNKGLFGAFGGSNWSLARLKEANDYARNHNLQGMSAASNNFSLARMVDPVWAGCVSSSDAESREWFAQNEVSLFAWSSQARGFFARGDRNFVSDGELTRCWYSDDNFERLNRARELATKKNTSPIVIAAAYVLTQPFPLYALIGPQNLSETRSSMTAFDVQLSPDEVRWLNLES